MLPRQKTECDLRLPPIDVSGIKFYDQMRFGPFYEDNDFDEEIENLDEDSDSEVNQKKSKTV